MIFKKDYLYNVKRGRFDWDQEDYVMVVTYVNSLEDPGFPVKTLIVSGKYRKGDSKINGWKNEVSINEETIIRELGPKVDYPEYLL